MNKYIHYKVSWGDTLETIANKFNLTEEDIKYINNIKQIYVGQVLIIPIDYPRIERLKKINTSLAYYLKRHINKQKIFNFYTYKKSHQN